MASNMVMEIKDGKLLEGFTDLFRGMLEKGVVDALLVPQEIPLGNIVGQTLVKDPDRLTGVNPIAPVMPVNSAKLVSNLTIKNPGERIGAVLRSCEARALVELVKLKQASLDNLITIGVDCLGTYSVPDYIQFAKEHNSPTLEFLKIIGGGNGSQKSQYQLRTACQVCEYPAPSNTDITIGFIGINSGEDHILQITERTDSKMLEKLELEERDKLDRREKAISQLIDEKVKRREELFEEFKREIANLPGLLSTLSACIRCYNCRTACPICYCKECVFETPTLTDEPEQYLRWAKKRGAITMPTDALLYHLTRLNHIVTSCVGCGQCESACPNNLPLLKIFRTVGHNTQKIFDYIPGRSVDDEPPLTTFKEEELDPR